MCRRRVLFEGEGHPHHGLPLFFHNVQVNRFIQYRCKDAIVDISIYPIQLLIFEIANTRHEVVAQQVTEGEDDLSIAVGIGRVLANLEDSVVFQQSIQDVQRFAWTTGDHLGAEDGVLVRDMGVDADGLLVVAVITRIVGGQQAAGPNRKELRIRGRYRAAAVYRAQRQLVMPVYNFGVGRLDRLVAHKVVQHVVQLIDGGIFDAGTHGDDAEIGRLGNDGGQQRSVEVERPGMMVLNWHKMTAEARLLVDFQQELLDPNGWQTGVNGFLYIGYGSWQRCFVVAFQLELAVANFGKGVALEMLFGQRSRGMKLAREDGSRLRGMGLLQLGVGGVPHGLPAGVTEGQIPKGDMMLALGQVEIAGSAEHP